MTTGSLPRLLLIDDEPSVRTALRHMLPTDSYAITEAGSAQDALDLLDEMQFDVVVSDICMPDLDGVELLRHIRTRGDDVPVILLTGQPDLVTAEAAMELRAFRYMAKPPRREEIRDAVRRAANLSRRLL